MSFVRCFLLGGAICVIGQVLLDKTKLSPARILTGFVVVGVLLGALGIYEPLVKACGAGATVPLTGFGYNLAKGVREAVDAEGFWGIFTGGIRSSAAGIATAMGAALLAALIFRPKNKD